MSVLGRNADKSATRISVVSAERTAAYVASIKEKTNKKYDFAPDFVLPEYNTGEKIRVRCCKDDLWFEVLPQNLISCVGCPLCRSCVGSQVALADRQLLFKRDIDQDGRFELISEYKGSRKPIMLRCKDSDHDGEEFKVSEATKWRQSKGCKKCRKRTGPKTMSTAKMVQKFIEHHGPDAFDYSQVVYKNWHNPVTITCRLGGHTFQQTPNNHLGAKSTNGCEECYRIRDSIHKAFTVEEFIQHARDVFPTKAYDYSQVVYVNGTTVVEIGCPERNHGYFKQAPRLHLLGYEGCRRCSHYGCSVVSLEWLRYKELIDHTTIRTILHIDGEFTIPGVGHVDGYSAELNKVYEFHGCHVHGCPSCHTPDAYNTFKQCPAIDLYNTTVKRAEDIKALGYEYEEMWNCQYKNRRKQIQTVIEANMTAV